MQVVYYVCVCQQHVSFGAGSQGFAPFVSSGKKSDVSITKLAWKFVKILIVSRARPVRVKVLGGEKSPPFLFLRSLSLLLRNGRFVTTRGAACCTPTRGMCVSLL